MKTRNRLLCLVLVLTMLLGVMPMAGAEDVENALWYTVGPGERREFSGSTTVNKGDTWYFKFYYGQTGTDPLSGTLASSDPGVISLTQNDYGDWNAAMAAAGTATLTFTPDNSSGSFTMNVTVTESASGEDTGGSEGERTLWYTNGPSERREFSGSTTVNKGDTWNFKFYYGTEASSAVVTSGTLESSDPGVISLTQNDYGDWDAAMAAAGTATLTFTPDNSSGSFTMNVTVTESASGDNSQTDLYFTVVDGSNNEGTPVQFTSMGSYTEGSNISVYLYYDTLENINKSTAARCTTGTFSSSDSEVISVSGPVSDMYSINFLKTGTATLTYALADMEFEITVTVTMKVPDAAFCTDPTESSVYYLGTEFTFTPNHREFYFAVIAICPLVIQEENITITAGSDYVDVTYVSGTSNYYKFTVKDNAPTDVPFNFAIACGVSEMGNSVTFTPSITLKYSANDDDAGGNYTGGSSSDNDGPSSGPQGNAIYIGDNYVVGFGMRDTSGALTINEGGWEMARGTSWTKAESNPLVKNWNLEVVAGTKKGDSTAAGDYSYYEEDEKATITINKVWIQLVDGDEGTFSLSGNGAVMNIDSYSSDAPTVDVYVKEGYVGGCVIWANVTATKNNGDSVTGDIGLRLRTWKDASNVYTRPANDTVEDLNAYLEELAKTVDPNSGVQSTYVVNLAPITYTGEIVIPDEFTGRHPGTCNMLQLIGASGTADCIGIGAEGCTYLNGGINADGGHLDAVNHVHFIANESVKNAAGETAALYNGYIHNVQNCSFKGYDIVADANKGMINLSSGNILYKNDVCFRLDLGSVPYDHSRNTWQYNTFIENGTAVRFDSFNVFINPYYFRIIESNFIDNDTDFDVNTSATVYMYQNYFGDIQNKQMGSAQADMDKFLTDLITVLPTDPAAKNYVKTNSPNIEKVQKSKVNTSPGREKFVQVPDLIPSLPGGGNPAPAAATMSLRSVSLLAEEETDYENKLVADWNLDTEILNAEADKLKIDASSFDEETENDKVISVVEVTVTETPDSIDISEKLLGTWNFGKTGGSGTTGDFNAKLTVVEGTDEITVTVVESAVLTAKQPTLTVPCDFDYATVTCDSEEVDSVLDTENDVITFVVEKGGEYVITKGEAPDDGTGDDTDRPIDTNVVTSSGDAAVDATGAEGSYEDVSAVAEKIVNATAEGLGGYASDEAVSVSKDSNIEDSATAALDEKKISAQEGETLHIHVQTYLDIKVEEADLGSKDTSDEASEKTITLDIQPMVQQIASYEDEPEKLDTEGDDKNAVVLSSEKLEVTTPVVLTIPLPAGFVDDGVETIYITHIKDDGTEYVYEGTVSTINGQLCVTFTNPHGFSIFVIANSDPSVASVDDTKCATFATAVQIVDNGGTIKVTKDCSDESAAVVSKEITFTVLANSGIEYNLKAGFGYTMTTEEVEGGVKYIFTKDDVEYGDIILPDVSGGADDTIRVEDLKDTSAFDSVLGVYTMQILSGTGSFVDVSKSDWFYSDVTALVSKGVINGYPDGSFRPQGVVTWGEALKLVMKAVGYGDIDANNGHWASGFMAMAIEKGLIPGEVELDAAINRGEIADLTAKAMKLGSANISNPFDDEAPASALALYEAGIIKGSADNGKLLYRAESTITRAEMAAIIWRVYCAK